MDPLAVANQTTATIERSIMNSSEYQVTAMTCGHCEMSVRDKVSTVPVVREIEISASTGRLGVTSDGPVENAVLAAVDEAVLAS